MFYTACLFGRDLNNITKVIHNDKATCVACWKFFVRRPADLFGTVQSLLFFTRVSPYFAPSRLFPTSTSL
jgi:hypothetical protein